MSNLKVRACCFILLTLSLSSPLESQTNPAPGVATGQKLGTIIKTAISTAAPGVSSILDLIWSHLSNPAAARATKTDLQQAAQKPAVQSSAKQLTVAAAQQQLEPVAQIADELAVINRFLTPTVLATQDLIIMKTKLPETTTDWSTISNNWELAKIQIANLKSVPDTDLSKIRDLYLRDKLTQIRNSNDTTVVSISQEISQKNLSDLKSDVATLLSTLANMTAVAGYEMAELQADINELATWARGAGGTEVASRQEIYKAFLDANVHALSQ